MLSSIRPFLDPLLTDASEFTDLFVGGGSVLLDVAARYPNLHLVANDKDPGVVALWAVLAGDRAGCEWLKALVQQALPTLALRDEFKARGGAVGDPVTRAFETLVLNRTSFSGNMTGGPLGGRHQRGETRIGSRWRPERLCNEIDRVHALLHGRCEVLSEDAADLLGRPVGPRAVIYLDPPYFSVGNDLYRECMTHEDHARLAERLRRRQDWVLSYDDAPEVHDLYGWASIVPVAARYSVARSRAARQELLIVPVAHPRCCGLNGLALLP